jgi:hypothetical protein
MKTSRSHFRTEYLTILATDQQPLESARRQSSYIGYLNNSARPTRVNARPLKSRQFPAFRTERQNLARGVHLQSPDALRCA